jgi:hypothetical protein
MWNLIKRRKWLFSGILTLTILLSVLSLQVKVIPETGNQTIGQGHLIITIGDSTYASGTVDYVCDGTDDDIQFQGALDALPATGGELQVLTGSYDFANATTVTRAIPNVKITGTGQGSSFTCDGATAIFTAGGNGWTISNIKTDAGGLAMGATTQWSWENVTINATYYAYRTDDATTGSSWSIPIGRTAYTISSSDATLIEKAQADVVCDGTADNVEIQAGITTVAVNGGVLQLVGKTFNITTTIIPASNVILVGQTSYHDDEENATTLVGGAAVGIIIDVPNDDHHYTFRNLRFSIPANTIGIKCEKANFPSVRIYECSFAGSSYVASYGMWLKTTYNSEVVNCRAYGLTNGIYLHSINNFFMHGGRITSCTIGINNVSNGDSNIFEMVDMSSNGTGMYIEGGSTTTIRSCWFENHTVGLGQEVGLWVYGSFRNSTIEYCTFGSNTTDLYSAGGAGAYHYDNIIKNCWFQGTEGVSVDTDMWGRLKLEENDYDGTVSWGANSNMSGTYSYHGQLASGNTNAISFAWHNTGTNNLVMKITLQVTVGGGTVGSLLEVGIADDAAGTNLGTEFFSALLLNNTGIYSSYVAGDTGTQTKAVLIKDGGSATDGWIVGKITVQNAANLAGNYTIEFVGGN